ncbi:MAG TPA: LPS assembly protein LptD [Candidatus Methylomirabilis sp.]|nr:LPS assembly protein LptD [Candidatus Methylomirabilis sp.]
MPGVLSRLLLTLFTLSFCFFIPMVSAQETGTHDLLNQIKELKSVVTIEADELERRARDKLTIAKGDVRIQMEDRVLYADEVELDQVKEVVWARGRVQLIDGGRRLDGDRFEYHYRKNTGVMYQARGAIPPATAFQGVEIHKEGERRYRLVEGRFTTCRICQPEPGGVDWEVRAKEAVLEQDDYLEAKSASFWVRGIPSLFTPYLIYPVGERRTGFLIPRIGYSNLSGFTYKQPFFWAISESQDLTLTGVYRTERGFEGEANYRYILGPEAVGSIDARIIQDLKSTTQDKIRTTVTARHDQQFNPELSLKADVNYVSDRVIQREFAETPSELRTANLASSRVFMTQLWQNYGLQLLVEDTRTLTEASDSRLRRLPELTFSAFPQRLFGSPVLFEMDASGTDLERSGVPDGGRADLFPKLSAPWRLLPWMTMIPSVGGRETAYTKRADGGGEGGLTRELFEASNALEARFYRSFQIGGERVDRLVHLVEPRVSYWYINPVDQQELPQFDRVDFISPQNRVTYSLTNRLLAKIKETDGSVRTHEVASLSLSQSLNLNPRERTFSDLFLSALTPERIDQAVREESARPLGNGFSQAQERRLSNLVATVRASPFRNLAFQGLAAINTESDRVDGIEAGVRFTYPEYGWVEMAHSFIRGRETAGLPGPFQDRETSGVVGRLLFTPVKNVAINYLGRYDSLRETSLENNVVVTYSTCCWLMGIQYVNREVIPGVRGAEDSVSFFFELLTGGAPAPPERGAQTLMRR